MKKTLFNLDEAKSIISSGKKFMVAGPEELLSQLPKGDWIGGTIPYFMGQDGGVKSKDLIQITELDPKIQNCAIKEYSAEELKNIPKDYFERGMSFIIIPAFSDPHLAYAKDAVTFDGIFKNPILGWVSGFDLDDPQGKAAVFNGKAGELIFDKAVVLHCELDSSFAANVDIINPFVSDREGITIEFPESTWSPSKCLINGEEANFAEFLQKINHNEQLPIMTDLGDSDINVCIMKIDSENKKVDLYNPVIAGFTYYLAKPLNDYAEDFRSQAPSHEADWSCNCVLNYLYSGLEGKKLNQLQGPVTFGEIAYLLLNQTCVYYDVKEVEALQKAS